MPKFYNDAEYYYVCIGSKVVYKTNAIMDLYNYVQKLRAQKKQFYIA